MTNEEIQFEEAMQKLEKVVTQLETGDVPLEEAMTLYKEGMELTVLCQGKLQRAEKQLMSMIDENGQTTQFNPQEGENADDN